MAENEVAKVSALPALPDPETLHEIMKENMEGLKASFQVIKIPSGASIAWTLEGEGEEPEILPSLTGVIIDHYTTRAYWKQAYGTAGGNGIPDCASLDAKVGNRPREKVGETNVYQFGECATCCWSQFGTAVDKNGNPARGQGCQVKHRVFFLMPDRSIFPSMIALSVMSAEKKYPGSISTYAVAQSSKGKRLSEIVTRVKLLKDKNADQVEYAKAAFFWVSDLNDEEKKKIAALKHMLAGAMRSKPFEADEAEDLGDPVENGGDNGEGFPWEKKGTV